MQMKQTLTRTLTHTLIAGLAFSAFASAQNRFVRLAWDTDPAHQAVVGFTPEGSSGSPYLLYGTTTDESSWQRVDAGKSYSHDGFKSRFVRLKNLKEDSPVYFKLCDDEGCDTDRYWFRTAPTEIKPFVFVAGGDTRTGWTTRRKGNALIAKIRPLFVMHGGDYTSRNSGRDWVQYFKDWKLTQSEDTIDGVDYQRIYPIVPAHGNHEDGDYATLCSIYGVDYNGDGQCNEEDTYGAMNVTPLLRMYVLNTQFKYSGWSRQARAMNRWLESDLANEGPKAQWRIAEYHKPMFPHYSGKHDNEILHEWWAQTFYDKGMNLVVESDTHVFKTTDILKPTRDGFTVSRKGGTMFVGEGTWGAPTRDADNAKRWTLDTESIQQFKVVRVFEDKMEVRTAQFGGRPAALSLEEREQDFTALPEGIEWWSITGFGEAMILRQNASGQSTLGEEESKEETTETPTQTEPKETEKPQQTEEPKTEKKPKRKEETTPPADPVEKPKPEVEEPAVTPEVKPETKRKKTERKPHTHKPRKHQERPVPKQSHKKVEPAPIPEETPVERPEETIVTQHEEHTPIEKHDQPAVDPTPKQEVETPVRREQPQPQEPEVEFDAVPAFDIFHFDSWFDFSFKNWFDDFKFDSWF